MPIGDFRYFLYPQRGTFHLKLGSLEAEPEIGSWGKCFPEGVFFQRGGIGEGSLRRGSKLLISKGVSSVGDWLPLGPLESPGHQGWRLFILRAKGLASCTLVSQAWAAGCPTSAPLMQQFGF